MDKPPHTNKHKPSFRWMYRRSGMYTTGGIQRTPPLPHRHNINGIQCQVTPICRISNTDHTYAQTVELSGHEAIDCTSIIFLQMNVPQGIKIDNCTTTIIPNANIF